VQWGTGPQPPAFLRRLGLIAAAGAAVLVIIALLGPITDLMARHDVSALPQVQRAAHLQSARETARTQLLTLSAGIFAAGALLFTALNFRLARQGQVTNRYTDAITQLGSDKLDIRIGGIYALERIARDSARDHSTIMEVLAAFIREHSREPWPPHDSDSEEWSRTTRPDVQAALTVIGRRDTRRDIAPIDLADANLTGANLAHAKLTDANLSRVNLATATLGSARLIRANLTDANLSGTYLIDADLSGADLYTSNLHFADFRCARLTGAKLAAACLTAATTADAGFVPPDFTDADLTGASWPPEVAAPPGWQLNSSGALVPSHANHGREKAN
jgi:hypothetical protein